MDKQATNNTKLNLNGKSTDTITWFVLGMITLMMLGANFAPIFGVPQWLFMVFIFGLGTILAVQSSPRKQKYDSTSEQSSNLLKIVVFPVTILAILVEVIWLGFFMQNWPLFAVWLPVTLLISVILYLTISVVSEKTTLPIFLLVPLAALLFGGLLRLIWPRFGYLNLFLFSFTILSFSIGLWHFRSRIR